jgi:hypothetical protein
MFDKLFAVQVSFSVITLGFCMGMIIANPEPIRISVFLPIVSHLIGVWVSATPSTLPLKQSGTSNPDDSALLNSTSPPNEETPLISNQPQGSDTNV